jgi:hypothetical protein
MNRDACAQKNVLFLLRPWKGCLEDPHGGWGICLKYVHRDVWNMYGVCMEYVWNMYGISIEYVWNMYGIFMDYVWSMY